MEGMLSCGDCSVQQSCAIGYLGKGYKCSALSSMALSIRRRKGQELAVEGVCTASLRIARGYRGQLCCRSEAPRHGLANHRAFRAHSLASKPGDGQLCHVLFGICAANFMCTQMLQETARLEWQSGEPHLAHESPIAL